MQPTGLSSPTPLTGQWRGRAIVGRVGRSVGTRRRRWLPEPTLRAGSGVCPSRPQTPPTAPAPATYDAQRHAPAAPRPSRHTSDSASQHSARSPPESLPAQEQADPLLCVGAGSRPGSRSAAREPAPPPVPTQQRTSPTAADRGQGGAGPPPPRQEPRRVEPSRPPRSVRLRRSGNARSPILHSGLCQCLLASWRRRVQPAHPCGIGGRHGCPTPGRSQASGVAG